MRPASYLCACDEAEVTLAGRLDSAGLVLHLFPHPQHLRHAPGLRHTADGREGRVPIKDLCDGAEADVPEMMLNAARKERAIAASRQAWKCASTNGPMSQPLPFPDDRLHRHDLPGSMWIACLANSTIRAMPFPPCPMIF